MEEFLILLIRFLIEVILQSAMSIPFDCACRLRHKPEHHAVEYSLGFLLVGGVIGWITFAFVPSFVRSPELRIAALFVSPPLAGAFGYYIAQWQQRARNPLLVPRYHFWYAFFFTLGLVIVRFTYRKYAIAI